MAEPEEDRYRERGEPGEPSTARERVNESPAQGDWGPQGSWGTFGTRGAWTETSPFGGHTDESLGAEIKQRLMTDGNLNTSGIEVSVQAGEATLTGTVADEGTKRRAAELAETVAGIKNVYNALRISP